MGRVAFYTFGILRAEYGDERVQAFIDRSPGVHDAAAAMPGHLETYRGVIDSTTFGPRFFVPGTHPRAPQTLSLWTDLTSVRAFAYRGLHAEALRLRREWFVPPEWPTYAIWWVADDEIPSWTEAPQRLEHLHDRGPMPYAFDFRTPFDENGQRIRLTSSPQATA